MKNNRIDWGKVRQTIFLALTVVIMAQINVHVFTDNFKISIAVICLPAFVYLIDRISIIPLTFLVTISVLASRVLVHWLETGGTDLQIYSFLPETIFYCAYGLMLFMPPPTWITRCVRDSSAYSRCSSPPSSSAR